MKIEIEGSLFQTRVLFSEDDIRRRILVLAEQINQDYSPQECLTVVVVLNGALLYAADLVRNLRMPTEIETIRLKSYEGTKSTGAIELLSPLPKHMAGRHVLIIEDIVDTGRSLHFLLQEIKKRNVLSYRICTLLDKEAARSFAVPIDYLGFKIENHFVIGYGLDLNGRYRNLPYIAELVREKTKKDLT